MRWKLDPRSALMVVLSKLTTVILNNQTMAPTTLLDRPEA
jgi:hypothetical protein